MPLSPGTRLGAYEILAALNAGGMGEVYCARDTRLDRSVAIKVLPAGRTATPDQRTRFAREAHAASSLNHPHISALYDVGQQDGVDFLVIEHVEGETLAATLERGPLPPDRALRYAGQMAQALDHAHRRGVVHRDLKPSNVMVTKAGVKLLDFGLAKLRQIHGNDEVGVRTRTMKADLTEPGAVLGTLQYMAPEQLEGKEVDGRADLFSFGAVLYEMLTGRRAFDGSSPASVIAAILGSDPVPATTIAREVAPAFDRIIAGCLAKDPEDRWQDARDLERAIGSVVDAPRSEPVPSAGPVSRRGLLAVVALCGVSLAIGAALRSALDRSGSPGSQPVARLAVPFTGPERYFGGLAVSPDGRHVVYRAGRRGSNALYLRSIDRSSAILVDGTGGGSTPFFSPDSRWLGFWNSRGLQKVRLAGGGAVRICETCDEITGATWGTDGTIVFATVGGGSLMRLSAEGGTPRAVTTRRAGERQYRNPDLLPDGRGLLFGVTGTRDAAYDQAWIEVLELDSGERRIVLEGARWARYVPSGHLVYARGGSLFAAPFDDRTRRVTGEPVLIASGVSMEGTAIHADVSDTGVVAHLPANLPPEANRRLVWLDRRGEIRPIRDEARYYLWPRLSPDGQRLATVVQGPTNTVWVFDIGRATFTRLPAKGEPFFAVWMPDRKTLAYSASGDGENALVLAAIDGGNERVIQQLGGQDRHFSTTFLDPEAVSPDGSFIVAVGSSPGTRRDIWMVPVGGSEKPFPLIQTPAEEYRPRISPDGKWLAYISNEAGPGQYEAYVRPFPGPGGRQQISTGGAIALAWAPSGREIIYREGGLNTPEIVRIMAVDVGAGSTFVAQAPRMLFALTERFQEPFDVTPDGQRFIMVQELEPRPTHLNVVLNWLVDLKQQAAGR